MEGCGQQGGGPDRDQDAVAVSNTTQDDPLLPPTDSSSFFSLKCVEPQHADVINRLTGFHQDSSFFDFTLKLKEGPVPFSRVHMASMSPVFYKLATVDMKESRSREVIMEHVTQDTWTCITSYYFTNRKLVSMDNVLDVLEASHMYELEKLVQYCSDFLQSHCCADNCLDLLKIATHFEFESLSQEARRVLADNFPTLCKNESFLSLEKTELLEMLEEEVMTTEDDLCQALLVWMKKNNSDADTCIKLFQHLRLNLLSDECFENLVLSHKDCLDFPSIQSLVTRENIRRMQSASNRHNEVKATKRRPCSANNSLLVMGQNWNGINLMYIWSFDERRWTQLPRPPLGPGKITSCTVLEETVIVPGVSVERSTHFFDLRTQVWSCGPDLVQLRCAPGMTTIGHTAYVVGGFNNVTSLSSIEEYSQASGQWTRTGRLQDPTEECGVAALGDTILVAGGDNHWVARVIQTFNVHTRTAAVLDTRLPRAMRHVRAASHGTSAFFVGEEGDLVQVRDVEGELQMASPEVLENYDPSNLWLGLLVSKSCICLLGRSQWESASCWDFTGKKISNDYIEDLPVDMPNCITLEVNIPPR